jgi:type II secretory pathway pseudopilin PulG
MRRGRGFTLIEVLVTFGIIVALAVMLLPALNGARLKSERIVATANMRQIGAAILICTSDRDGVLPGPLQVGQKSSYSTNSKQLACVLAPYLDIGEPAPNQTVKVFYSPAFARAMKGKDPKDIHPFLLNGAPKVDGVRITPFGSDAKNKEAEPMKLAAVGPNVWTLCDADQQNPGVQGHPWEPNTPKTIIHGRERLALYLDGSVKSIPSSELTDFPPPPPPKPPPPPPPKP